MLASCTLLVSMSFSSGGVDILLMLVERDAGREAMREGSWRMKVADDEYGP